MFTLSDTEKRNPREVAPVIVEGPEPSNDFTFGLVQMNQELANLEAGVPVEDFK